MQDVVVVQVEKPYCGGLGGEANILHSHLSSSIQHVVFPFSFRSQPAQYIDSSLALYDFFSRHIGASKISDFLTLSHFHTFADSIVAEQRAAQLVHRDH